MATDILQTVVAAIARVKEIPADDITLERTFEELGMDSLDGLNMVFELEKAFGITMPNEDALQVRDVREVVQALERVLAGIAVGAGGAPGVPTTVSTL